MTPDRRPVRWLHLLGLGKPLPEESAQLEVEHHIAELTDRLVAEGMNVDEARREAERHFGDRARYTAHMRRLEEARLRGDRWTAVFEVIRQSVVAVARTARREPGFTAAVVLTLGLGIGANATMYGIIDRLLLSGPEHVVEPGRVMRVFVERLQGRPPALSLTSSMSYPDYTDLREHSGFTGVAAYVVQGEVTVGSGVSAERLDVVRTTAEYFPLLGAVAHLGRFYTSEEAQPGSDPIAVLGFESWRTVYGADPNVIGRSIELGGELFTIIGVAPRNFTGVDLQRVDVWLPLEQYEPFSGQNACVTNRTCYGLGVIARLDSGETRTAAEQQSTSLHLNGRRETIAEGRYSDRSRILLMPLIDARGSQASAESRVAVWLLGVSIVVLLIGCANIANLFLARGTRQRSATSVRMALGGSRSAIITQVVLQSVLFAVIGGAAALLIARWGGDLIRTALFPDVLFPHSASTLRTIGLTLLLAVVAGVFTGVLPAVQSAASDHVPRLYRAGNGPTARRSRLRAMLTVLQGGMTAVLLVAAGLFVRSLDQLRSLDLGMDVDQLVVVRFEYRDRFPDTSRSLDLTLDAMTRLEALPSVILTAATSGGLGSNLFATLPVRPNGTDSVIPTPGGGPWFEVVTPGFFETVGLEVIRGRGFDATDRSDAERTTIVNETMAAMFWPASDPLGQCLVQRNVEGCAYRVVGVVDDAARAGYIEPPAPVFYVPSAQAPPNIGVHAVYVRTSAPADEVARDVATVLRGFSPEVRFTSAIAVRDHLAPQARSWTLGATLFTVFGLLALVVAGIGLYSVLAFDVAQRTREIGIRTALGARKARLLRSVVTQGTSLGAIGIMLGLGAAYLAAPYIQDLLFETSPRDPAVFTTVGLTLLAVSVAASLMPALRATRVDPVTALKTD